MAINSGTVSLVRHSAGILKLPKNKLNGMDRKTRKIMRINRMYHPQRDADRLQIPRTEGEWRLLSIADCGETEVQNFSLSQHQLEERLLGFSRSESIVSHYEGTEPTFKKQKKEERQKQ